MKYRRACIIDNLYGLLQYLLLTSAKDIKETYFFWGEDIKDEIRCHFSGTTIKRPSFFPYYLVKKLSVHYLKYLRWPFLRKVSFWGQDNMPYSSPLVGNHSITLIDDGVLSYKYIPRKKTFRWLRRIISGSLESQNSMGYSTNVKKIYLTGIYPIPSKLVEKVQIVDYASIWKEADITKKNIILNTFNLTQDVISKFQSYKAILFTQPLSEDKLMSEEEKLGIYREIIKESGPILIKVHPRERTDYQSIFPDCYVFNLPIPFELLNLLDLRFDDVYTVFSTAALTLPYKANIHFLGTRVHPNLLNKYGDITNERK